MNSIYACGLLDDLNIEPEQDPKDVNKINVSIRCEEVQPKSVEVKRGGSRAGKAGGAGMGSSTQHPSCCAPRGTVLKSILNLISL